MRDFVNLFGISDVLIQNDKDINTYNYKINYEQLNQKQDALIKSSEAFLINSLAK